MRENKERESGIPDRDEDSRFWSKASTETFLVFAVNVFHVTPTTNQIQNIAVCAHIDQSKVSFSDQSKVLFSAESLLHREELLPC